MYTNTLIDAYKEHMHFAQYKQVAMELGLKPQMLTEIRKGRTHLNERIALFIADQIGEDKKKVLIGLAADRAKSPEEKAIWQQITKKFNGLGITINSLIPMTYVAGVTLSLHKYALCILCNQLNINKIYLN